MPVPYAIQFVGLGTVTETGGTDSAWAPTDFKYRQLDLIRVNFNGQFPGDPAAEEISVGKMEDEQPKEEPAKPLFGAFLLPNGARYGENG
jgi:hypothetical protein